MKDKTGLDGAGDYKARLGKRVKGIRVRRETITPVFFFSIAAFGIYVFLAVADEVAQGEIRQFDERFLLLFRDDADPSRVLGPFWLQETMVEFTTLGGYPVIILTLLAVIGLLLILRRFGPAMFVLLSVWFGWLVSHALKRFYDRPRPDLVEHLDTVHTASFPSGHAMMSTVIYLTLAALVVRFFDDMRVRAYVICVAVVISGLVGISRIYLGVHWPSDVIAGWALGAAWASFSWLVVTLLHIWGREHDINPRDR